MSRIRVLPDDLINQIAAGEVIERPASVVKELIENSLDAGARTIGIDIESGGRRRIRVADDGEGLDRDDALLALERHATSKLQASADLGRIVTLGFRGEALPAIASVSRLTLTSSRDGRSGSRLEVEAGRIRRAEPAGHPRGTTIDVRDLFFNTPARAKFLKTPQTELGHISELVAAFAVTMPRVNLTVSHETRRILETTAVPGERDRIRQIYGPAWGDAIPIAAARSGLTIGGLLLPPDAAAGSRRLQHLYVNGRLVRDRLVGHAILAACQEFLPKDRHASLFLFITCPPEAVDVNVHPAKAEVRFAEPRLVHDLVQTAIRGALTSAMPVTAIGQPTAVEETAGATGGASLDPRERSRAVHEATWRYLAGAVAEAPSRFPATTLEPPLLLREVGEEAVALAHYRESYIVASDREGLLLVDQHAAHERILYEKLAAREPDGPTGERQSLLFPFATEVPRRLAPRRSELIDEMERLGITAEPFGEGTLMITQAPSLLDASSLPGLMERLLQEIGDEEPASGPSLSRGEKLLATIACHAAIKVRMPLTLEKMNYLIKELFRTASPLKCPHGRPAVLRFSQAAIERGFDRR